MASPAARIRNIGDDWVLASESGDGGNRTRVRGRETNGVYRLSRRLDLASRVYAGQR